MGAYAFNYNAVWVNEDSKARGIKKIVIKNNGYIQIISSKKGREHDWGKSRYIRTVNGLLATWQGRKSAYKVVVLENVNNHKMRATIKYLRGTGRDDMTKIIYLKKPIKLYQKYLGKWSNEDGVTRGITHLDITRSNRELFVRVWKSCRSGECDMGNYKARVTGNQARLRLDWGNSRKVLTIKGLDRDHRGGYRTLEATITRDSHNNRSRSRTFYFRKSRMR